MAVKKSDRFLFNRTENSGLLLGISVYILDVGILGINGCKLAFPICGIRGAVKLRCILACRFATMTSGVNFCISCVGS